MGNATRKVGHGLDVGLSFCRVKCKKVWTHFSVALQNDLLFVIDFHPFIPVVWSRGPGLCILRNTNVLIDDLQLYVQYIASP